MKYVLYRSTAWLIVILTFIAGMATGFALLAVIISFNS